MLTRELAGWGSVCRDCLREPLNSQPTPQLHPCNLGTLPSAGRKSWMTQLPSFLPMGEASHRCWGEAQASAATSSLIT